MSTPSIQTLITQAQQVLNLKSSNEIRATLAAILANANVGTPLNPNLTTQQLWDEFYEIVRQPSDDILSIITDQMMRMVFSPPAPGGAGADKQVIFNDGGVLAGDAGLMYNKTTDTLTAGSATITGAATVGTTLGVTGVSTLASANVTGDLKAGTTSNFASSRLCVQGTAGTSTPDVTIGIPVNSGGNTGLAIGRSASTNGYIFLDAYKAAVGGTELVLNSINGGTVLVGLSTVVAAGGCLQLKSGVTFPATQSASSDANTLDDYEEGTWTIGLTFGGGNTGLTTSASTGRYTKIGRQVTVCGRFEILNKGSSTGAAVITGLPFSIANATEALQAASFRFNGVSYTGAFQGYGTAGSTTIPLEQISEAGSLTDLTNSNFVNGTSIQISFTYTV